MKLRHPLQQSKLLIIALAVLAATACAQESSRTSDRGGYTRTSRANQYEPTYGYGGQEQRLDRQSADQAYRQSFDLPGISSGGALRLEKIGSTEARPGQDYRYQLRVTNTSNVTLENIQIFDRLVSGPMMEPRRVEAYPREAPERPAPRSEMRTAPAPRQREVTPYRTTPESPDFGPDRQMPRERETSQGQAAPGSRINLEAQSPSGYARTEEDVRLSESGQIAPAQPLPQKNQPPMSEQPQQNQVYAMPAEEQGHQAAEEKPLNEQVWRIGTLRPGESRTIDAHLPVNEEGQFTQCFAASYQPAVCTTLNVTRPSLSLTKSGPEQAAICEDISYRYVLTNTGTGALRDVRVEDELPQGLATLDGSRRITLSAGDLQPGQSVEKSVRVRATQPGEFTSTAQAIDASGFTIRSQEVRTVIWQPELAVRVEGPETAYLGQPVNYNVTVTNRSQFPVRNVTLRTEGLRGVELAQQDGQRGRSATEGSDLGTLGPGESRTFTLTSRNPTQGNLEGRIIATAACAQPVAQAIRTQVVGTPALMLQAVDLADPVTVGNLARYEITVTNQGTATAHNVQVRVELPQQLEFVSAQGQTNLQGAPSGNRFDFPTVRELAPGAKATWRVDTRAVTAGDITFRVLVVSDEITKPGVKEEPTRLIGGAPGRAAPAGQQRSAPQEETTTPPAGPEGGTP